MHVHTFLMSLYVFMSLYVPLGGSAPSLCLFTSVCYVAFCLVFRVYRLAQKLFFDHIVVLSKKEIEFAPTFDQRTPPWFWLRIGRDPSSNGAKGLGWVPYSDSLVVNGAFNSVYWHFAGNAKTKWGNNAENYISQTAVNHFNKIILKAYHRQKKKKLFVLNDKSELCFTFKSQHIPISGISFYLSLSMCFFPLFLALYLFVIDTLDMEQHTPIVTTKDKMYHSLVLKRCRDPVVECRNEGSIIDYMAHWMSCSLDDFVFINNIACGGVEYKATAPKSIKGLDQEVYVDEQGFAHHEYPHKLLNEIQMYPNVPLYHYPQLQKNIYIARKYFPTIRWIAYIPWSPKYFTVEYFQLNREWMYDWALPRHNRFYFMSLLPMYAERFRYLASKHSPMHIQTTDSYRYCFTHCIVI